MSILKWLGFGEGRDPALGDTDTVRRIVRELETMPEEAARYIAAFAYVLGRVAYADREFSRDEIETMELLVEQFGGLSAPQAVLVVAIAKNQAELFAGTENFLVTQEFRDVSTPEQREQLLHCLFAVAAADESISNQEDGQIRQIATELGFSHRDFVGVRAAYSDKREVIKMGRPGG